MPESGPSGENDKRIKTLSINKIDYLQLKWDVTKESYNTYKRKQSFIVLTLTVNTYNI